MKKLLLIISLIFIQNCFAQQNFLKKSELRDSLDAYNFQNNGLNDSLVLIRSEISDTSATLRQVIIDTASAIRTDIGDLNTAYVDSVANLKLDKTALADSVLANNLINRQELDDTSQAIHQAIIDSSGAIRSYTDLKLDKSALKDSINSRNLVYEPELVDSILSVNSNLADSMSQMLTVDEFIDTLETKEIDSLHVNKIFSTVNTSAAKPYLQLTSTHSNGAVYGGLQLGSRGLTNNTFSNFLAITRPMFGSISEGNLETVGIVKIGTNKTRYLALRANGGGAGTIVLGDSASSTVPLGMIFYSNNVERQRISGTGIVSFTSDTVKNSGVFRNTGLVNSIAGYLHNGTNINTIYAPLANPTFTGTATTPALNISSETASTIASFDESKNLKSLATATYPSLTELSYVKGVTSAIQTQLGTKLNLTGGTLTGTLTGTTINATTGFTLNGTSINTTGTLTNVAYKGQNNNFTTGQSITGTTINTGALYTRSSTFSTGFTQQLFVQTRNNEAGTEWSQIRFGQVATNKMFIEVHNQADAKGSLILAPYGTGYVGVRNTSPTEALDVTGNIKASGTITAPTLTASTTVTAPVITQQSTTAYESAPLGSELLSSSNWTSTDWTGDFASGFTHTTGNTTALTNTLAAVTNNLYQITYTVTNRTAGTFSITFGGVTTSGLSATGAVGIKATSTGTLSIAPTTDFNGTIVISIKQITGIYNPTYVIKDNAGNNTFEIRSSLASLNNTFIGVSAGRYNTTGIYNTAQGMNSLFSLTTGNQNSAQGVYSLPSLTTGGGNSAQGAYSLFSLTTGNYNSAQGMNSLFSLTTGYWNTAQGYAAGRYLANGSTAHTTGDYGTYIGAYTKAKEDGTTNETVIGSNAIGNGSNTVTIGSSAVTANYFNGFVQAGSFRLSALNTAPASPTDTGTTGEIRITATAIFICIATNTWVKANLATW